MTHEISVGEIFVFGSNEAGRHGKGAALHAVKNYGAVRGCGFGLQGQSFAIPTKDKTITTLSIDRIRTYVDRFIDFARSNPDMRFFVTALGTGLAGLSHADMAPLFAKAPDNCRLPPEWVEILAVTEDN